MNYSFFLEFYHLKELLAKEHQSLSLDFLFDLLHLHRQFYLLQLIHHNFSTLKIFSRGSHLLSLLNTIHLI